jgi:hypothetical protein
LSYKKLQRILFVLPLLVFAFVAAVYVTLSATGDFSAGVPSGFLSRKRTPAKFWSSSWGSAYLFLQA